MLETFREHSKGWLAKLILVLITVPFALWGIDSYLQKAGSGVAVAKVDGSNVTVQEYENAMRNLRNQMQSEGKVDQALLDSPEVKQSILNKLIFAKLLNATVKHEHFALSDESLSKFIITLPEFQKDGKFSQEAYDSVLMQNNLLPSQFEARMRGELLVQQVKDGVAAAAFVPNAVFENAVRVDRQQRTVSVADVNASDFLPQVKVSESDVKTYYDKNKDKFRVPEQVKVEYLTFSANNLIAGMQVSDDEARKYYDENAAQFQGDEQRRASHILIGFGGKTDEASKKAAHDKAEEVLAEVRKHPEKFSELAKKYSQDPGSAKNGGDLGTFGRGMMVKPFEDAVFSMAPGAISDLVETQFGYHIIKLTGIEGQGQSFEAVKPKIRAELMYQKSRTKFAEQAETFSNMVYEQSDSLEPAAKAFGLQVQTSGWMSRADLAKFFKSEKLATSVFSDEILKDKRNTEAVEIGPNTLLSARVVDYKPVAQRSLTEVGPAIEDFLKHEQALAMAVKKGKQVMEALRTGKDAGYPLDWIPDVVIDRKNAQGLTDAVMKQAFRINADTLPAYGAVDNGQNGYTLIRVSKVDSQSVEDEDEKNLLRGEMQTALTEEFSNAYLVSLRDKADISLNQQLMGSGSQPQ